MTKATQMFVLSAKRGSDGIAVFLDFDGGWNESITAAVIARSPDEINALERRGAYDAAHNMIVKPHLLPVHDGHERIVPIKNSETNAAQVRMCSRRGGLSVADMIVRLRPSQTKSLWQLGCFSNAPRLHCS